MNGLARWYSRTVEEIEKGKASLAETKRQAWPRGQDLFDDAAKGLRDFGEAQVAALQLEAAQRARAQRSGQAAPKGASARSVGLRGPQSPNPPARAAGGSRGYLVDLKNPDKIPFMTTCADKDCRHSYIDEYPASGLGMGPMSHAELKAGIARFLSGAPIDPGPRVTFINDNPKNPSPRQPLTTSTARMVAAGILDSGVRSVNINSTTGGHEKNKYSRHNAALAVDINRINGRPVRSGNLDALRLQGAFSQQPNIGENFGPDAQTKISYRGGRPTPTPMYSMRRGHWNHVHIARQR